jgi:hypothetical protein
VAEHAIADHPAVGSYQNAVTVVWTILRETLALVSATCATCDGGEEVLKAVSGDVADEVERDAEVTHVVYCAGFEKPGLIAGWSVKDQIDTTIRCCAT